MCTENTNKKSCLELGSILLVQSSSVWREIRESRAPCGTLRCGTRRMDVDIHWTRDGEGRHSTPETPQHHQHHHKALVLLPTRGWLPQGSLKFLQTTSHDGIIVCTLHLKTTSLLTQASDSDGAGLLQLPYTPT